MSLAGLFILLMVLACQPNAPSTPTSTATPVSLANDVLVEVEDGKIVSINYQSGRAISPGDRTFFESWDTMERLFSTVEEELNSESLQVKGISKISKSTSYKASSSA